MGEKDSLTKRFMSRPDVFADAFNYLMYDGDPVIRPEDLREMDTSSIALPYDEAEDGQKPVQKSRDILKEWVCMTDDRAAYMVLGVENQTNIHYAMPVRNMLYDALQYENQVKEAARDNRGKRAAKKASTANDPDGEYLSGYGKQDRLKPVITLVVYFGQKEWDAPTSLFEMFGPADVRMLPFAQEYKINLVTPATMSVERLTKLTSEFREAMLFMKYTEDQAKMKETVDGDPRFQCMERDTVTMLNKLTGAHMKINHGEEKVDMCLAIQQMIDEGCEEGYAKGRAERREEDFAEGWAKGRAERHEEDFAEGREEGREEERASNVRAMISLMRSLNLSDSDIFEKLKTSFALTDEQTARYIEMAEVRE